MYLRDIGFILKKHGLSHGIVLAYNASAMKNFLLLAYLPSWSPQ